LQEPDTWAITLTCDELLCLAAFLGLPQPQGLEAALRRLNGPEGQARMDMARRTLLERGWLVDESGEGLSVDAALGTVVHGATHSELTALLAVTDESGAQAQRWVHLATSLIVEQETGDEEVTLTAVRAADLVGARLAPFLGAPQTPAAPGAAFAVLADELAQAQQEAIDDEWAACGSRLQAAGVPASAAGALGAALGRALSIGSLAVWRRGAAGLHPVAHHGWLASEQGAWLLQTSHGDLYRVLFTPMAMSEIATALWAAMYSTLTVLEG
jgi:hypothetical protein